MGIRTRYASVLVVITAFAQAFAREPAPPDFSPDPTVAWGRLARGDADFWPVPGRVPPVAGDPAHPYVPNGTAAQPTYRIGDLSNPNLKPWVAAAMKTDNDEVLAGKPAFTPRSSCASSGVPSFMASGAPNPIYFVQTEKQVWIILSADHQVRRIYLNAGHSRHPKPTWYGESVGHYEGDTLVIDTIGLNDRTFVDIYRTPHTDQIHVQERWRLVNNGQMLEVQFTVADPGAFYHPFTAMRRYKRVAEEMQEDVCAENNVDVATGKQNPVPTAMISDF